MPTKPPGVLILLTLLTLLTACAPTGVSTGGEVRIRVADGSDGLAGLSRVVITWRDAALHTAGQPRDAGWVDIPLTQKTVELGAAGQTGQLIAVAPFPVGAYDRVRVEVAEVYGERDGQRVPIRNIVEPIYLPAPLTRSAEIRIDMIVLPLLNPAAPERYAVYTKHVEVK